MYWPQNNLGAIRNMIDSNCSMIHAGNWEEEIEKDWRWLKNLDLYRLQYCQTIIEEAQRDYGILNVTTGQPFNTTLMKPTPIPGKVGIYVRDTQDLVKMFSEILEDDVQIERWISGR